MRWRRRELAYGVGSFVVFVVLARAAIAWGGDLLPIPLWLATASTIAVGLVGGRSVWPAVFVGGSLIANTVVGFWLFDETVEGMIVTGASVAVETLLALYLLARLVDVEHGLRRTRESAKLIAIIALVSIVGASVATLNASSSIIDDQSEGWVRWALGDLVGLLLLVPLAVSIRSPWLVSMNGRHRVEAVAHGIAVVGLTVLSFNIEMPLLYLVFAMVCWTAIRFGLQLSAPVAVIVAITATAISGSGSGPLFTGGVDPVVQIQIFNASVAVCALVVGVHATRAWDDQQQLAATLRALPDAAAVRSRDGGLRAVWLPPGLTHLREALTLHAPPVSSNDPVTTAAPGSVPPSRLIKVADQTLEHRITPIDEDNDLHLFRDVTEIDRARRDMKIARERLQRIEADERQRLGRALHDGPIQELAAVQIRLDLEEIDSAIDFGEERRVTLELLASSITALRSVTNSLQPLASDHRRLDAELRGVADRFLDGVDVTIEMDPTLAGSLEESESNTLFLVGREALVNVAFHARASAVRVELDADADAIEMRISDDGIGMHAAQTGSGMHFGLQLMRERMENLGGTLTFTNRSGGGTEVRARVIADEGARQLDVEGRK